jgi:hypothetical protein
MKPTKTAQVLAPLFVCLLVPVLGAGTTGCKKDEPPPPLPSATPTAAPTPPPAPIELVPEEAPAPSASASATAPKGTGTGSSFKKCCAALRQNAASAPEPNKTYMMNAATACDMGAQMPALSGMLRGAGMPAACK